MLTVTFQKSKLGDTPAFSLSMPDAKLCLAALSEEQAQAVVKKTLRAYNDGSGKGGLRLFDEANKIWTAEHFANIISQGMAFSSKTTYDATDFATAWADSVGEIVAGVFTNADGVLNEKAVAAMKDWLALAVRHGGKGQLAEKQCDAIIKYFGEVAGDDLIATAVVNAKTRKQEFEAIAATEALFD